MQMLFSRPARFFSVLRSALCCAALSLSLPGVAQAQVARAQVTQAQVTPSSVPEGMVLVPEGAFQMGTNDGAGLNGSDAMPQRSVTLPAFYIDKTEVTNEQYKQYCDATGYPAPANWSGGNYPSGQADFPVQRVNWYEAQAFARWKGKRLPSEAEWEKAARGTDGRRYPWGNGDWSGDKLVNGTEGPEAVGSKPNGASPFGALDMAGNLYEWTSDWYAAYPNTPTPIAQFGTVYKVVRGGAFAGADFLTRTTTRDIMRPTSRNEWIGFRCAQSAVKTP